MNITELVHNGVYTQALQTEKRFVILCGGRGAGRSYAFEDKIQLLLQGQTGYKVRILLMRYVKENIEKSVWKSVQDMLSRTGLMAKVTKNDSNRKIIICDGHEIYAEGFTSKDKANDAKLKSLKGFTHIFIEEATEVKDQSDFDMLNQSLRTFNKVENGVVKTIMPQIFMNFNMPHKDHWIIRKFFVRVPSEHDGYYYVKLKNSMQASAELAFATYKDNLIWLYNISHRPMFDEVTGRPIMNEKTGKQRMRKLPQEEVDQELYQTYEHLNDTEYAEDKHKYKVEILGLVHSGGSGKVFTDWETITKAEFDKIDAPMKGGIDFGFTNDPTAIVGIKKVGRNVYVHCYTYEKALSSAMIASRIQKLIPGWEYMEFISDAQEERVITDLQLHGIQAVKAAKGSGSRSAGVNHMLTYKVFFTEESTMIAEETDTYEWLKKKDGTPSNEPSDGNDHCLDAIRYVLFTRYYSANMSVWDTIYSSMKVKV